MTEQKTWYEAIVMPALLRHARTTYGAAMRKGLAEAGFADIPKNGLYVIGAMAKSGGWMPLGRLVEELGVSKQAAGQLVDTLVQGDYLERTADPLDRRKLSVALTARGHEAAAAQSKAREAIDAELLARVGEDTVHQTRIALAALIAMKHDDDHGEDEG